MTTRKERVQKALSGKTCDKCGEFAKLYPLCTGEYCRKCYCLLREIECKFIGRTLKK